MILPTVEKELTFVGQVEVDPITKNPIGFAPPPKQWKPWNKVRLAVGDLPAFSTILGDGVTPFEGPAVLIGLDVLAQRQVILEAGPDDKRARRVWVSPS